MVALIRGSSLLLNPPPPSFARKSHDFRAGGLRERGLAAPAHAGRGGECRIARPNPRPPRKGLVEMPEMTEEQEEVVALLLVPVVRPERTLASALPRFPRAVCGLLSGPLRRPELAEIARPSCQERPQAANETGVVRGVRHNWRLGQTFCLSGLSGLLRTERYKLFIAASMVGRHAAEVSRISWRPSARGSPGGRPGLGGHA